jgi:hypothetical protein
MVAGIFDALSTKSLRIRLELTLSIFAGFAGLFSGTTTNVVKEAGLFVLLHTHGVVEFLKLLIEFLEINLFFRLSLHRHGLKGLSRNLTLGS